MRLWGLALVLIVSLFSSRASVAQEKERSAPLVVRVGVHLLSIGKLDVATGTYTVDFYLSLRSTEDMGDLHLEFMNGRASSIDKLYDTPTEKQYRYQANLMTNIDVRRFPWDEHALPIIIESATRQSKDIVFQLDTERTAIDEAVLIVGWKLVPRFTTHVRSHVYTSYDNEAYSQIAFQVHIERLVFISSLKTFFPVLCFVLITFASLILTVEKLDSRLGMNTAMLMASVMFHLTTTSQLPPAAYLTIADKAIIAAYLTIGLNLFLTVLMMRLMQKTDRVDDARRLRERAFTVVPLFALFAYVLVALT